MDKENLFNFPNEFPYEFASNYSTESETDDEEFTGLTHRFSRSTSLQEPHFSFKEKRVFSGLPESAFGRSDSGYFPAMLQPPVVKTDEDAWNLVYATAGEIARMKIRMSLSISNRGVIGVPQGFENHRRYPWGMSDGVTVFRQRHLCLNGGGSALSPPQVKNERLRQRLHERKLVFNGSGGGCDGGSTTVKRECVGTGVFLPRRYCDNPPGSRKRQACWPSNLPAGMIQSSTKSFFPITGPLQLQAHINGGFVSHYELLTGRRKAMILAAQQQHWRRTNIDGGVMELPAGKNPAVLLPKEWTY